METMYYYDKYELIITEKVSWGTEHDYIGDTRLTPGSTISGYGRFTQNKDTGDLIPQNPLVLTYNGTSVTSGPGESYIYVPLHSQIIWAYTFERFDGIYNEQPEYKYGLFSVQEHWSVLVQRNDYSKGDFIETLIAAAGVYPVNGIQGDYWWVRRDMEQPEPDTFTIYPRVGGSIKTANTGWVRVSGQLKEITDIWARVGGQLKKV